MAKPISQVIANSEEIRDEIVENANTATKVGTNLVDLGENLSNALTPGISIAQVDSSSPILGQSITTTYAQIRLTNLVIFESPAGVITTTYPSALDVITMGKTGIYKFGATFYVEGPTNTELFVKAYKNGAEISPGDPVGINTLGAGKPVPLPFSGHIPLALGDEITYYARFDAGTGTIDINGGNAVWELTNY